MGKKYKVLTQFIHNNELVFGEFYISGKNEEDAIWQIKDQILAYKGAKVIEIEAIEPIKEMK